jgi:hypothetical protein
MITSTTYAPKSRKPRGSYQLPIVWNNPFPHNQHMASGSSNNENAPSGGQNPPSDEGDHLCVNMVKSYIDVAT